MVKKLTKKQYEKLVAEGKLIPREVEAAEEELGPPQPTDEEIADRRQRRQHKEILDALNRVAEQVQKIDVSVEAPEVEVNVPAPEVTVNTPEQPEQPRPVHMHIKKITRDGQNRIATADITIGYEDGTISDTGKKHH